MFDPFKGIQETLDDIVLKIERETKSAIRASERHVALGDYEMDAATRGHLERKRHILRQDWMKLRQRLPPFTTWNGKYLEAHPVTTENEHLLRDF